MMTIIHTKIPNPKNENSDSATASTISMIHQQKKK